MKILLTTRYYPVDPRNPISILDLASWLRKNGHLVDCYYTHNIPSNKVYDLVGFSVLHGFGPVDDTEIIETALLLKNRFNVPTVVGGKWAIRTQEQNRQLLRDHGVIVHVGAGEDFFSPNQPVDYENYPSWQKIDFETLNDFHPEIMTTRGCPYHCNFCHNTERKLNFFSIKRSIDNIELVGSLLQAGGREANNSRIFIIDDVFTLKPDRLKSLYNEAKNRGLDLAHRLEFFSHVNFVTPQILDCLDLLRPIQIQMGIESGDDRMLKLMNKGFTSEKAEKAIQSIRARGYGIAGLFLIGYPGETIESLENTLQFVGRNRSCFSYRWVSFYQPVYGTVGYEEAIKRNPNFVSMTNRDVSYLEPGLTPAILESYKQRIMG